MKKRIIIELENDVAKKIIKEKLIKLEFGNGKLIDVYNPIDILPKEIRQIRIGLNELKKKGFSAQLIRSYILRKYNISGSVYDTVIKGLTDVLNHIQKENQLKKLKE